MLSSIFIHWILQIFYWTFIILSIFLLSSRNHIIANRGEEKRREKVWASERWMNHWICENERTFFSFPANTRERIVVRIFVLQQKLEKILKLNFSFYMLYSQFNKKNIATFIHLLSVNFFEFSFSLFKFFKFLLLLLFCYNNTFSCWIFFTFIEMFVRCGKRKVAPLKFKTPMPLLKGV